MKSILILLFSVNVWAQSETPTQSVKTVVVPAESEVLLSSNRYKFGFFSLASVKAKDYERGGASIGSYNYLGASYKLDQDSSVAFRYVFFYDSAGFKFNPATFKEENIPHRTDVGDPYVSYSRYNIAEMGEWKLGGQTRFYFPVARFTRAQKTQGQVRLETYLERNLRKYDKINYVSKLDYYIQSQTAYVDEEVPRNNDGTVQNRAVRQTKQFKWEHYLEYDWSLDKAYSIKPLAGFQENWYYESDAEKLDRRHDTDLKIAAGVEVRPMKGLSFLLSLENMSPLRNLKEEVAIGRPENNSWVLITYASF